MGWTPPSKFTVILTMIFMVFGIFILLDVHSLFWASMLPPLVIATYDVWLFIGLGLFFLTWFVFYLGVKLKGL